MEAIDINTITPDEDMFSRANEINVAGSAACHQEVLMTAVLQLP